VLRLSTASILALGLASGCGGPGLRLQPPQPPPPNVPMPTDVTWHHGEAALSASADLTMIVIPASRSIAGSTPEERNIAYDDHAASLGSSTARDHKWFDTEEDRHVVELATFRLDLMPVTNAAYAEFVADGGAPAPAMDEATWKQQGFVQKWPDEVERFVWKDGQPPPNREDHPVVLVSWHDAAAYCVWRGQVVGHPRRLPSAHELEKAARGLEGMPYPWGPTFEPRKLNSAVGGSHDTVPVGSMPEVPGPFGVLDLAGNVFQWTATPWPTDRPASSAPNAKMTVKGSAWDDHAGLGRGAAWHGRVRTVRHVIVGFRCAGDGAS
jgi:formylglycine-generating enzyme required for sulfatase activity